MKIIQIPNNGTVTVQWIEESNVDNHNGISSSKIKSRTYEGLMRGDVVMLKYGHELNDEILEHLGALNSKEK